MFPITLYGSPISCMRLKKPPVTNLLALVSIHKFNSIVIIKKMKKPIHTKMYTILNMGQIYSYRPDLKISSKRNFFLP